MDGPEATKEIRALGYHAPIIGVTGNTLAMDLQRFEECGCNRVIGKPFSLELFLQYMAEAVREHRRSSIRIASIKKAPAEQLG
jgi:CheY-like chemotaxis protein